MSFFGAERKAPSLVLVQEHDPVFGEERYFDATRPGSFFLRNEPERKERRSEGREGTRSRIGALRDDTPKRHPDNGPGQDPGLCRLF